MICLDFLDWLSANVDDVHTHVINTVSEKGGWRTLPPDHPDLPRLVDTRHHVYFRVAPLRTFPDEGRGRKYDPGFFTAFWLDIDYNTKNAPGKTYPSPDQVQEILAKLPAPNAIIYSGGGCYPLWRFTTPLPTEDPQSHRLLTDLHNAALPHWTSRNLDLDQTADMSRVLRAPGSFNTKYDNVPQVTVECNTVVPDYDPYTLLSLVRNSSGSLPVPPPEKRATHRAPYNVTEPTLTTAFHNLCDPGLIVRRAGLEFSDRQVPPTALDFDDAIELFNPSSEEYPSRRSALLNPSGVVFFYGTVPHALRDIVQTGEGVTLHAISSQLQLISPSHKQVEEELRDLRTEFERLLAVFRQTGEIPDGYPYAHGIKDRDAISRLAEAYRDKILGQKGFPTDALPDGLREAVMYLEEDQLIPPDAGTLAYLTSISAMCIGRFTYRNRDRYYPSLYGILSANPGGGKSTLETLVTAPALKYAVECREAWVSYKNDLEEREQKIRQQLKQDPDDPRLKGDLTSVQIEKLRRPPSVVAENFTPAALQRMVLHPQGVFLASAEMRKVERYFVADGKDQTDELLPAWSGDSVKFHRVKDDETIHGYANAAVLLMGQPDVVEGWLTDATGLDSGLLARFLYSIHNNDTSDWERDVSDIDSHYVDAVEAVVLKGYRRLHPTAEPNPTRIMYTEDATELHLDWGVDYIAPIKKDQESTLFHSFCQKYHEIAKRIAGLFAVYEYLNKPVQQEGPIVTKEVMERAISVTEWYMSGVLEKLREATRGDALSLLEACEKAATSANKMGKFTATDVVRADRAAYRDAKAAKAAIIRSVRQGYLDKVNGTNYVISDTGRKLLGYV